MAHSGKTYRVTEVVGTSSRAYPACFFTASAASAAATGSR